MDRRTSRVRAAVIVALLVVGVFALPTSGPAESGKEAQPSCTVLSYKPGDPGMLEVEFKHVDKMKHAYVAAAQWDRPEEIWVQVGRTLKKDGKVELEGYDFKGRVLVYQGLSQAGEDFLKAAQKSAAEDKPVTQAQVDGAQVTVLCEYEVK